MPTYVYKFVKTGETIEVQQSFTDDTLTKHKHPETGRLMAVKKVFQPVGVTFKGSGFFKNDNRDKKSTTMPSGSDSGSSDSGSSDSGSSDSGSSSSGETSSKDAPAKKSESKSDTKKSETKKASASTSSSSD